MWTSGVLQAEYQCERHNLVLCVVSNELIVVDSKYKSFTLNTNIAMHPWTPATLWTISIKLTYNENDN